MAFGPQGDVAAGPKFARRYTDGGVRLVPGKNGLFELVISKVTSSDEGIYECNGTEWTHENGGKWIKIVESTREMGTVSVTPTGKRAGEIFKSYDMIIMQKKMLWCILEMVSLDNKFYTSDYISISECISSLTLFLGPKHPVLGSSSKHSTSCSSLTEEAFT